MAILSGVLEQHQIDAIRPGLMNDADVERTTIYFTHYLFETYRSLGEIDAFFSRMDLWFELEKNGFRTTPEMPEPSRSDCHAWGAHPVYHFFATLLGIRPASFGFASVVIEPQLGPLRQISGTLPHPRGEIRAELMRDGERITGQITLPDGVDGVLLVGRKKITLRPGMQRIG
jgi:alpha-L-rhamnosidase